MRRSFAALFACLLLAFAAGCGGSEAPTQAESTPEESASTPTPAATSEAASGDASEVAGIEIRNAKDLSQEPIIKVPGGAEPPDELVSRDLVKGDGRRIAGGDEVSVQYTGVALSTGEKFDASWDRGGEPFNFAIGGQVISGWNQGVLGMREGGRRLLIIPPDLGYGEQGAGGAIGPNETLIFVIDALKSN